MQSPSFAPDPILTHDLAAIASCFTGVVMGKIELDPESETVD
jgi:hypothetical protein